MKNIEKVSDLWLHLEDSYIKKGIAMKCNTRKEFLIKLSGLDANGNDSIDKIKSLLARESSTYTKEEQEKYSVLISLLDIVKLNLKTLPEIDYNLDEFVANLIKESKAVVDEVVDVREFLENISTPDRNIVRLSLKDMYKNFKEFAPEIVRLEGSKIVKYEVLDNVLENVVAFQSPRDIESYVRKLQGLPSIDDFHRLSVAYYGHTGSKKPMIFFNTNEFSLDETTGKVKLYLDGKSYKIQEVKDISLPGKETHTLYISTVNTETDKLQAVYFV